MASPTVRLAIIANVMTPYRLHLLRRIQNELPDVELHTILTHRTPNQPWEMEWADLRVERIPVHDQGRNSLVSQIRAVRTIRAYLENHHIDHAIINGYNDLTRIVLLRRLPKSGSAVFLRGDSNLASNATKPKWRRRFKRPFLRWLTNRCAGIFYMGVLGRQYYQHYGHPDVPLFDMPYDIDLDQFRYAPPSSETTDRVAIFVGRLAPEKAVVDLVQQFVQLSPDFPAWRLRVIGDGPLAERIDALVVEGEGRVDRVGFVDHSRLPRVYESADFLVLPSHTEPWGVVATEAMASGLAVIATDVVGAASELAEYGPKVVHRIAPGRDALGRALRIAMSEDWRRSQSARSAVESWHEAKDPVRALGLALGLSPRRVS